MKSEYKADSITVRGAVATVLDVGVLGAFGAMKLQSHPLIVIVAAAGISAVFGSERIHLGRWIEMLGRGHAVPKGGES